MFLISIVAYKCICQITECLNFLYVQYEYLKTVQFIYVLVYMSFYMDIMIYRKLPFFFVIGKFSSLTLLKKMFHPKFFPIFNFSSWKNFKTKY